jgi:hypothetical protein
MPGYAANVRVGAIAYNAIHTYVGPLVMAGYSFGSNRPAIFCYLSYGSLTSVLTECLDLG